MRRLSTGSSIALLLAAGLTLSPLRAADRLQWSTTPDKAASTIADSTAVRAAATSNSTRVKLAVHRTCERH
jgi:hypothetical protein